MFIFKQCCLHNSSNNEEEFTVTLGTHTVTTHFQETCTQAHACTHTHTHTHTHTLSLSFSHACTQKHAHMHAGAHTHVHTHTHTRMCFVLKTGIGPCCCIQLTIVQLLSLFAMLF